MNYAVRAAQAEDKAGWLVLWLAYCEFYEHIPSNEVTETTWGRIVSSDSTLQGLVAVAEHSAIVGFANYVSHPNTWSTAGVCYLEDLFVQPEARKGGIARALIDRLLEIARDKGWNRVYWMTDETNAVARRLYDTYTKADGFVRYVVPVNQ